MLVVRLDRICFYLPEYLHRTTIGVALNTVLTVGVPDAWLMPNRAGKVAPRRALPAAK